MNVKPKKSLGQHFLRNRGVAMRIAESVTHHRGYTDLLEIGPGTGALTTCLLEAHPNTDLQVMDIDRDSIAFLKEADFIANDHIIEADFLHANLGEILGETYGVVGNFPYNISTQILFRVFDERDHVPEVVGMFQKEVAMRIASGPGNKQYGILSVLLQLFYDIEYLFTVGADEFIPPPKVESGVIRLRRNDVTTVSCEIKDFVKVVKVGFNQRRKMLRGSLKSIVPEGKEIPEEIGSRRPEELSPEEFVALATHLFPKKS
ncbi:MAG: 16S rRNA (adenine(1518)-N(6)/adenine(1519)-N(6))-dimethyltransferase RsmA [Flavobacteriales bacterium]|nr:16S rRNA (adenine(1518)-N(6)/adenine(1519)-N(6))-dimethyltransferase RsmA [Flavobacteriales bacterium]MDG1781639.1 16S rRNA (adenine(1518)-N(6)/adenine(1519)-N(6))-dimethyltransferase RsmA [Flavobacteriales bacterium]MDG2246781.1 16S rRNA (adenine(1518)-N(6)/adenine(1519)-N(6))-dimethyltransferase RsmA [Flavobacteriales bacterium]